MSLINLMVSADVKHYVYLLTIPSLFLPLRPSLISHMVSVDVKQHVYLQQHVYLLTSLFLPLRLSLISLMVSVDVKQHVYLYAVSSTELLFSTFLNIIIFNLVYIYWDKV